MICLHSTAKKQRRLVLFAKVDAYFAWVKQKYAQIAHNSTIEKALAYSIYPKEYLRIFLTDRNVPIDVRKFNFSIYTSIKKYVPNPC